MSTVSDAIVSFWRRISKAAKIAFFAALAVGLVTHMPFAANYFVNHDSISYITRELASTMLSQSKWLQGYVFYLAGKTVSPNVSVLTSILLIGLSAGITVSALRIKQAVYAALTGCMMALTPSVVSTFIYQQSIGFFMALLLAATGVYCTVRYKKWGWIPGVLFLTLSLGTYQAYIGYAAGLFIILCVMHALDESVSAKETTLVGLKYLGILAGSIALYYLILRVWLKCTGTALSEYQAIDQVLSLRKLSPDTIVGASIESYRKVMLFFRFDAYGDTSSANLLKLLYPLTIVLIIAATIYIACRDRLYRKPLKLLLALILLLLFPLAIHAIGVLGLNQHTHWLMIYAFVLMFVLLLKLADWMDALPQIRLNRAQCRRIINAIPIALCSLTLLVTTLTSYKWFLLDNQCYQRLRFSYEHTYAAGVQLAYDISRAEGFDEAVTPVAIVYTYDNDSFFVQKKHLDFDYLSNYTGIDDGAGLLSDRSQIESLLHNFIGVDYLFANSDQVAALSGDPEVMDMPLYPKPGSIKNIDGMLVVKLSEVQA